VLKKNNKEKKIFKKTMFDSYQENIHLIVHSKMLVFLLDCLTLNEENVQVCFDMSRKNFTRFWKI